MKIRIFGVAALLFATFAAVHTTPARAAGGPSSFECARFCMVALCPQPQECGLHQGPNGLQCGCFGGIGGPVGP